MHVYTYICSEIKTNENEKNNNYSNGSDAGNGR